MLGNSIIAVHGLLGDWTDTWTDKESKKLWLRDFLPSTLPTARIWSFGFNSSVFSQSTSDIEDVSRTLLDRIDSVRENSQAREKPIIFISHSLGGIIVKKAKQSSIIHFPSSQLTDTRR